MSNVKTTKITERYYARIRADNAFAEVERAFNRPSWCIPIQAGRQREANAPVGGALSPVTVVG